MDDTILLRHKGFFHPDNQKVTSVTVYGAGSVGSHVIYELAKLGVKNLIVHDFDKVELHNIGNQFYKLDDVGKTKVEALLENVTQFTGNDLRISATKITPEFIFEFAMDSLHIMTFDNIESRKIVFDCLRGFPLTLIDVRAGGEGWELYEVRMDNEEACKWYEPKLQGEFSEAKCGERTVIYNVTNLASEVCNHFKKLNLNIGRPRNIRREMKTYRMLSGAVPSQKGE